MEPRTLTAKPEGAAQIREDLEILLNAARANFADHNVRKTADALCAAHAGAEQHKFYREAAQLRKAITILATGGKPRLLTHIQPLFCEG